MPCAVAHACGPDGQMRAFDNVRVESGKVSLRPAQQEDRLHVRRWLAQPQVQAWWSNAASAEAEISLAMSSQAALCRIVEQDRAPIGYAQAVEIGLWAGPQPAGAAPGSWNVDLFIAAGQKCGRTLAGEALALLVEEVFATTLAVACCALVPIRNESTVRAYEAARFHWRQICADPLLGPSWLMVRERPP